MSMTPVLIKSSGVQQCIKPSNGEHFSLKELQDYVGGYIEVVRLKNDRLMIVDEEGKCKNKPINLTASLVLFSENRCDRIVGDVVLCDRKYIL